MAKALLYEVTGRGVFPLDMLRYDCCWPCDSRAVDVIMDEADFHENRSDFFTKSRSAIIVSHKPPTIERWNSFGWGVRMMKK